MQRDAPAGIPQTIPDLETNSNWNFQYGKFGENFEEKFSRMDDGWDVEFLRTTIPKIRWFLVSK